MAASRAQSRQSPGAEWTAPEVSPQPQVSASRLQTLCVGQASPTVGWRDVHPHRSVGGRTPGRVDGGRLWSHQQGECPDLTNFDDFESVRDRAGAGERLVPGHRANLQQARDEENQD